MKKIIKSYRFPIILLLSMILGSLVGIFFPDSATYLKPFGDIYFKYDVYGSSANSIFYFSK